MHRKETPEFFVGDTVQVVFEPYRECPFNWVRGMNAYCGAQAEIVSKVYNDEYETFGYRIDEDARAFMWCGNCFIPVVETPDFDITDEEFDKLLLAEGV